MKSRREENVEATRQALLDAARVLFAESGYEAVSMNEIAAKARVTTGALYHHYRNKKALFLAMAEALEAEILARGSAVEGADPWQRFRNSFAQVIEICADPVIQRILFVEAPQVIGPDAWREIELKYAYGGMRQALERLMAAGLLRPYPTDFLARTLLGVLREAAAEIAADGGPETRARVDDLVDRVFEAISTTGR